MKRFFTILALPLLLMCGGAVYAANLELSATSITCSTVDAGNRPDCPVVSVKANGGSVTITNIHKPLVLQTTRPESCAPGKTLSTNQSCTLELTIKSSEDGAGDLVRTVTIETSNAGTYTLTLNAFATGLRFIPNLLQFEDVGIGSSREVTVTAEAVGNTVTFKDPMADGQPPGFSIIGGTCAAGMVLSPGSTCTMQVRFSPVQEGPVTGNFRVGYNTTIVFLNLEANGVPGVAWNVGEWSGWDSTCSATAKRTRSVTCESGGEVVDDSRCPAPKPATYETREDFSGCTYHWSYGEFGACTGGSGIWFTGDWSPSVGCGQLEQFRNVTCSLVANSGTRTRMVACERGDGTFVEDAMCEGEKPEATQSCTPTDETLCGPKPAERQTVTLNNGCSRCVPDPANEKYCLLFPI